MNIFWTRTFPGVALWCRPMLYCHTKLTCRLIIFINCGVEKHLALIFCQRLSNRTWWVQSVCMKPNRKVCIPSLDVNDIQTANMFALDSIKTLYLKACRGSAAIFSNLRQPILLIPRLPAANVPKSAAFRGILFFIGILRILRIIYLWKTEQGSQPTILLLQ